MSLQQKKGYLMILTAGILWGSIGFFTTVLKQMGAEAATVAFLRIGVGAVILIPLMVAMQGRKLFLIDGKGLAMCLILGIFCQALFNFAYTESVNRVGVATASVLLYTSPIFVTVMARVFFKEKIGKVKLIALFMNVLGCIMTVTGGDFSSVHFSVYGVAAGVAAGFLYAMMTILSTLMHDYEPLTVVFYSFVFGAAVLGIFSGSFENIVQIASPVFVLAAAGFGLIPTVGSYFFYMKGLAQRLETSKVPVVASIETVVAAAIGVLVFQEGLSVGKFAGICCVLASIAVMNLFVKDKKSEADQIENEEVF